jgi:hypothetical protein
VVDDATGILGVVTEGNITSRLLANRLKPSDSVTKALYAQFRRVTVGTTLAELARIFDRDHFAVVVQTQRTYRGGGGGTTERSVVVGLVSRIDLLKYITRHASDHAPPTPSNGPASSPVHHVSPTNAVSGGVALKPAPGGCPVPHGAGGFPASNSGAAAKPQ